MAAYLGNASALAIAIWSARDGLVLDRRVVALAVLVTGAAIAVLAGLAEPEWLIARILLAIGILARRGDRVDAEAARKGDASDGVDRLMRFLLLTQYYPPEVGAAQIRLSAFARELREAGHEVDVVTALPNYPSGTLDPADRWRLGRRERIDGVDVARVWHFTATGAGVRRLASYLSFTATGLVAALGARRPDVVFVESPPLFLGVAGWLAARRFGAAMVLNVSDLWPDSVRDIGAFSSGPWLGMAERLEHWLYRRATAVTAVTEGIRDRLIQLKGVEPEKVLFLPNGADTRVFHPVQRSQDHPAPHGRGLYMPGTTDSRRAST